MLYLTTKRTQKDFDASPHTESDGADYSFFFFFSGAADEGLPRKQRKVRMKENIDTTCGGVSDAGSPWARTTYSAPWSVITSAPRSVPLMLKLATLPRSRRERDWWRATPGRSGNAPRCHHPQKAPPSAPRDACRDVFQMQRFWNAAFQMPRVWNAAASLGSVALDEQCRTVSETAARRSAHA